MEYNVRPGKVCCVYKIENRVNHKVYVGRSKNLRNRFSQYMRDFKKQAGYHMNIYLLRSMLKHGIDKFSMSVLEECDISSLPKRELHWMRELDSLGEKGYNLRSDTESGMVVHQKTSDKISARLKVEWSGGIREGHSDKLKASWKLRDRSVQASLMTKTLTKWVYKVSGGEDLTYKQLADLGMKSVLSSFHRKQADEVTYKGLRIERFKIKT